MGSSEGRLEAYLKPIYGLIPDGYYICHRVSVSRFWLSFSSLKKVIQFLATADGFLMATLSSMCKPLKNRVYIVLPKKVIHSMRNRRPIPEGYTLSTA
jgi:hypothetical protein